MGDEEDETDEQYKERLNEAKIKFKVQRDEIYNKKSNGAFKHLFRSKGFLWLSNKPDLFFQMSQAAIDMSVDVGGPWVCTMEAKDKPMAVGGGWKKPS